MSHRRSRSHSVWRRVFADRLYLGLLAVLMLIQTLTSLVDYFDFTLHLAHECRSTWALSSPLLSVSVRLLAAFLLLPPALFFLRATLPGRWPYLALWCSLAISLAALLWDAHWFL